MLRLNSRTKKGKNGAMIEQSNEYGEVKGGMKTIAPVWSEVSCISKE